MNKEELVRLTRLIQCGVCGSPYTEEYINELGAQDEITFIEVYCPYCTTACLVIVVGEISTKKEPITEEDKKIILEEIKNGNFKKLFGVK